MISVIIPVYNVEKYLRKCLDSVVSQTYRDIEIILVDDGSTDFSGSICDEYALKDRRIQVYHETNKGVSNARNKGLQIAKGEWVLFIDSDDWIDTQLLEVCWERICKVEDADICFFGHKEVVDTGKSQIKEETNACTKLVCRDDFLGLQYRIFNRDRFACCDKKLIKLSSPCKLYRRELLISNRIFFPETLVNGEDGIFNLYAYQYARCGICVEKVLYYYRIHNNSVTQSYRVKVEQEFEKLHIEYRKFLNITNNQNCFEQVFQERLIWSFSFCCILKYCHPDNPYDYSRRKKQFLREYRKNYENVIKSVSLKEFGFQKRVLFYFLKKENFLAISTLCYIQRIVNKIL